MCDRFDSSRVELVNWVWIWPDLSSKQLWLDCSQILFRLLHLKLAICNATRLKCDSVLYFLLIVHVAWIATFSSWIFVGRSFKAYRTPVSVVWSLKSQFWVDWSYNLVSCCCWIFETNFNCFDSVVKFKFEPLKWVAVYSISIWTWLKRNCSCCSLQL